MYLKIIYGSHMVVDTVGSHFTSHSSVPDVSFLNGTLHPSTCILGSKNVHHVSFYRRTTMFSVFVSPPNERSLSPFFS